MGAQGTAILDFGAFPGKSDASVNVIGQAAILAGSLVEAWLRPVATADHSADEHMLETLNIFAADIIAGTGFTVYGLNTSEIGEPDWPPLTAGRQSVQESATKNLGGKGTTLWGQWTVAWVWN